jgi:hypothetical protein
VTATASFKIAGGADTCSGQTIAPKEICAFYVEFVPASVGEATGGIEVTYHDGSRTQLALEGNGIAALTASPVQLNFGNVVVTGTSTPRRVTLTNKGTSSAQISTVTASAPFKIAGGINTCSGETIAPKKTCAFYVEFVPVRAGGATGEISVIYDATIIEMALKGNGIAKR